MDMEKEKARPEKRHEENPLHRIRVWDIPTRVFHWLVVVLVIFSFITGNIGGLAMEYHEWSGVAILVLVLFRLVWGFAGGRYSRFRNFLSRPSVVIAYAASLPGKEAQRHIGHNPLGGWSIIAMLSSLLVQAGTGLFANDDILTEGPLVHWVSKATSDWLTGIHQLNRIVLATLITIHLLAVFYYLIVKRENLLKPMVTGIKTWPEKVESFGGSPWAALIITALLAVVVYVTIY